MSLVLPSSGDITESPWPTYNPWDRKDSIVAKWISLANQYGGSYESLGKCSVKGWDIVLFKFGNPAGGRVMFDAQLHGNEFYGHETLYTFIKWLLSSSDSDAVRIRERNQILVVPNVNYRWGRTNYNVPTYFTPTLKDPSGDGDLIGINMNRNFSPTWNSSLRTSNTDACSGDHADSELEAQALINAWNLYHPRIYYNLHQGASLSHIVTSTSTQAKADVAKVKELAPAIASRLGASNWASNANAGSGGSSGHAVSGAAKYGLLGWMTELRSGWSNDASIRVELNSGAIYKGFKALVIAMCNAVESAPQVTYTLTVLPSVGGSTTPMSGSYQYASGGTVSILAVPDSGYNFDHWLIDGVSTSQNPASVTMNANHTVQAVFTPETVDQYVLTVLIGAGKGVTDPPVGDSSYPAGTSVTLTATPADTHLFSRWIVDGVSVYNSTVTVVMNGNHVAEARFFRPVITIATTVGGTTSPAPGEYIEDKGTVVTVIPVRERGYRFSHWIVDGSIQDTTFSISITVDRNRTLQAMFAKSVRYHIRIESTPTAQAVKNPAGVTPLELEIYEDESLLIEV